MNVTQKVPSLNQGSSKSKRGEIGVLPWQILPLVSPNDAGARDSGSTGKVGIR
jgi:hypothetical protein